MCISTDSIFVDTDRKEKMSETTWSCTRCKSPLKENHYCPNCDINPMERIKQLEEVRITFINFLGRLIVGEKFTPEKLNEYLGIILDQKALEGK